MNAFQKYVFRQILGPLASILAALTAIAMLTQGLNQLDMIVDQRGSPATFLWVTLLATPQIVSLILPLALFFAVAYAINRLQSDSELVVAFSAGISPSQVIAPVFRLAMLAALAHLACNVVAQPAAYREMRTMLYSLRSDLASSLVRDGSFTTPAAGLTLYARTTDARGEMHDVFIQDARDGAHPTTYNARRGAAVMVEGRPAVVLRDGQIMQAQQDGAVNLLDFDQYVIEVGDLIHEPDAIVLKPSDRYLYELFAPNLTNFYDQQNITKFAAEGHSRLSSPLLNLALAMIALASLLGGDFNRRGYGARVAAGAAIALAVRLAALGIQSAANLSAVVNYVQYGFPLAVTLIAIFVMTRGRRVRGGANPPDRYTFREFTDEPYAAAMT